MRRLLHINTFLPHFLLVLVFFVSGCKGSDSDKISEGIITYDLTYPYLKDSFMQGMMPKKLTMEFKNNVYKNSIESAMFGTSLVSFCEDSSLLFMMHFGKKYYYAELDAALKDSMISINPVPDIVDLKTTDSLAGFLCHKYMGVFDNLEDGYDGDIYECKDIDIKNSNWCNPFDELEGVLLGYEINQFGLQMRFRATEVKDTIVSDSVFMVPPNYKKVSLERILFELEEISKAL